MLAHFDVLHAIAGLLVGFLVGLTGVGGGSLMTPLLVLMFGVSPATAVGTDLLFASTTKIAGSLVHGWRATIDWVIVRRLASGSVPAAVVTLMIISGIGHPPRAANHTMLVVLGVMLIITALTTLFQEQLAQLAKRYHPAKATPSRWPTIVLGACLGAAVTLTSVGAGAMGVTALLMLYPALRVSRIVGSDIAHAVPLTMVAGFGHWFIGDVNGLLLVNLLVGSIPGVVAGSLLSSRSPDRVLRPVLAMVLLFSGYKLLA
ncbi:sulfite exporter TauE/SafE family protein [Novosphingobium sp.]|uniref:sulfite exporter TauE/SafE family protein n=1 Tax=Novosphingobium sp. TaxID=1874826 RepID=UPI00334039A4